MAVCFGVGQSSVTFMSSSFVNSDSSAFLINGGLTLPCLCGIPTQSETTCPGIWYDKCSQQLRLALSSGNTGWSAGGAMISAINQGNGGGTQNAAYHYGGTLGTGNPAVACTEEYNGSSWSSGGALPAVRRLLFRGCVGTQNAGLAVFGFNAPANQSTTYEYNGTSWSTGGAGGCVIRNGATFGTQNSATAATGFTSVDVNGTQEYNGTSWSGGGNVITARQSVNGAGQSQNQGWIAGGNAGGTIVSCAETYNGTSWASTAAVPTVWQIGGSTGRQAYGLLVGGRDASSIFSCAFLYDGYLWTSTCNLITAVACNAAAGDGGTGIVFSGQNPAGTVVGCTQEWNNPWNYYQVGT
jgi:hypothetical protein